jgi:hypothetical protein
MRLLAEAATNKSNFGGERVMDDLTTSRIEPLTQSNDLDKDLLKKGPSPKRKKPEKPPPSPSVESDDSVEDIHQFDELA